MKTISRLFNWIFYFLDNLLDDEWYKRPTIDAPPPRPKDGHDKRGKKTGGRS